MTKRDKDRHSQTGRDRKTSKDGAGGKYTWGAPGCEKDDELIMSKGDPNFDENSLSENEAQPSETFIMASSDTTDGSKTLPSSSATTSNNSTKK